LFCSRKREYWRINKSGIMIKTALKFIFRIVLFLIALPAIYTFFAVLFSIIPVHTDQSGDEEIEIFLKSNGIHVAFVLPIETASNDWRKVFGVDRNIPDNARYISIGWGDMNFYRNTPQWSDLTFPIALKALFLKTGSAIHIDYYSAVQTGRWCKPVHISQKQYQDIVHYVESELQRDSQDKIIPVNDLHYTEFDTFYEARRSYNLFFTCNTWTNKCLKQAGLRACLWTPFDKGVLYQYRKE